MRQLLGVVLCLIGASGASAETKLDLSKVENRKQVLKEREKMDCAGIYKQTQLRVDVVGKLTLQAADLAKLTEMTVAMGQKRREFCEVYKTTPEFNKEEYLAVYGGLDKRDSDVSRIIDKAAASPARKPGTPAATDLTAWAAEFETITVAPADGVSGAIRSMEKAIAQATPLSYAVMSRGTPAFLDWSYTNAPLDVRGIIARRDDAPTRDLLYQTGRDANPTEPPGLGSAPLPWWIQLPLLAVAGGIGWFVSVRRRP